MAISVKFFARLREELDMDSVHCDFKDTLTALKVWQEVTGKDVLPDKVLIAINQEYADANQVIKDNDEVAFFPPVTGG